MEYEHIYTICETSTKHISNLTTDMYNIYAPYCMMKLYGIPAEWNEEKIEEAIDCEDTAIFLGEIEGYLVLGSAIAAKGGNMYDYCDAADGKLEFAVSALMEADGPLSENLGNDVQNHFHIVKMEVSDKTVIPKLLDELPEMIFTHLHVMPDIISVSPDPLPHEKSRLEQIQEDLAMMAYYETAKKLYKKIFGDGSNDSDDNEVSDTPQLALSPEQLNIVMGRRNEGASYPIEYIDREQWKPFIEAGYIEWRSTRVMFKFIE